MNYELETQIMPESDAEMLDADIRPLLEKYAERFAALDGGATEVNCYAVPTAIAVMVQVAMKVGDKMLTDRGVVHSAKIVTSAVGSALGVQINSIADPEGKAILLDVLAQSLGAGLASKVGPEHDPAMVDDLK